MNTKLCGSNEQNCTDVDVDYGARFSGKSKVSPTNSTTINLGASGVYTGGFVEVLHLSSVSVIAFSSHGSAAGGLKIQWSSNGTNVDMTNSITVPANQGKQLKSSVKARYARVVYTNGTTAQTTFRLQTLLAPFNPSDIEVSFAPGASVVPTLGNNIYYEDMTLVARDTNISSAWTTVYSVSNPFGGLLLGFIINLEKMNEANPAKSWFIRMSIDGVDLLNGATGLSMAEFLNTAIYTFTDDPAKNSEFMGIQLQDNSFRFEGPMNLPVEYSSSIVIQIRKASESKKFKAGIANITRRQ